MPPRPRPLSNHDRLVWAAYVQSVRVLSGREAIPPPPVPSTPPPPASAPQPPSVGPSVTARFTPALTTGHQPAGLDNATWNRFRGGKLSPARTIDLHGKTAQAAFLALDRFLRAAHADHLRCVEVITGRGTGEQGGVIRRELPMWLNLPALRPLVLATAHPSAINPGSTRLLLRRPKTPR